MAPTLTHMILVLLFSALAVALTLSRNYRTYAFTAWVFAFVAASMVWPRAFGTWFGFDLKFLIVPLIQIIMFGMGTTLSVADFTRVLAMPWAVVVGVAVQYTIMPFVGFGLALAFAFEPEIAVGMVLIGAAPSGVASNVINYLARCNVPLSVTMTAISTLLAPVMTPLMMRLLVGQHLEVGFVRMMVDICNMILVPVVAGLAANRLLYSARPQLQRGSTLAAIAAVSLVLALGVALLPNQMLGALQSGLVLGFILVGVTTLARLLIEIVLHGPKHWMDRALPLVSMTAICLILAVITSRSSEDLKRVGLLLLGATVSHNLIGYFLGYWAARALRLSAIDARTVAVEVGMQNGGMASGLAMNTLQSTQAALAAAIFGPWQNVSGSILASWWRGRPPQGAVSTTPSRPPQEPVSSAHD
jgi:bile acid:Na+ symporter, BASS family